MSETETRSAQAEGVPARQTEPLTYPIAVYILFLLSYAVGITAIIGIIIAHLKAAEADPVSLSHFRFQMRTFWYSLLLACIGGVLTLILIGWLVLVAVAIWALIRQVKGLITAIDRKPIPDPTTFSW